MVYSPASFACKFPFLFFSWAKNHTEFRLYFLGRYAIESSQSVLIQSQVFLGVPSHTEDQWQELVITTGTRILICVRCQSQLIFFAGWSLAYLERFVISDIEKPSGTSIRKCEVVGDYESSWLWARLLEL